MNLLFPIGVAILLILFLVTHFEQVITLVSYLLMICLIVAVAGAIGYGLYNSLGPATAVLLAVVGAGLLAMTKVGYSIAGFIKGFIQGYRSHPEKQA
jgi:hypothetical protein